MSDNDGESVPVNSLHAEEGADELVDSAPMEPYLQLGTDVVSGADPGRSLEEIARLPVEKRYVWRVALALKWAFADFDDLSVTADRDTLQADDLSNVLELLRLRPTQFCLFLQALVGPEEMKRIMISAIATAGRAGLARQSE